MCYTATYCYTVLKWSLLSALLDQQTQRKRHCLSLGVTLSAPVPGSCACAAVVCGRSTWASISIHRVRRPLWFSELSSPGHYNPPRHAFYL